MKPQNLEESLVWYYIIGTYGFYFIGALSLLSPALAWFLTFYLFKKLWNQTEATPAEETVSFPSITVMVWVVAVLVMEFALIIGHINFDLGILKIITSSIGLAKTWALLALFPLIGCLKIRPELIYRAVCILCLQSLAFIALSYLASTMHLPETLYVSPLRFIGGGGSGNPILYDVNLYSYDVTTNTIRLALFTPWPPALGIVGCIHFFLASQELNRKWRCIGIVGAIAMAVASVSRLAIVCIPITLFLTWILVNFTRPTTQVLIGIVSFLSGIFGSLLLNTIEVLQENFTKARPDSSKLRAALARVAITRWQEAPLWGHGITEPKGPKFLKYMPIGTHHTWISLLFTKGLIGFIALAVPLLCSFLDLLIQVQKNETARVGLSVLLVLCLFTFSENIEALAYVYWPSLVLMGIAFRKSPHLKKQLTLAG